MGMISLLLTTIVSLSPPSFSIPPTLGHVTQTSAKILMKSDRETPLRLVVLDETGKTVFEETTTPDREADGKVLFDITGLEVNHTYDYFVDADDMPLHASTFHTQALREAKAPVALAFASCANEKAETGKVWERIGLEKCDALVLIGDTPYIDSTDLAKQRQRYKAFANVPSLARLLASTPVYSTWDDHDFGRNDTDGNLKGKENSRRAFLESRPNPVPGDATNGIYTKFQFGDVEVFLLDARWFARTEPSTFDPEKPTLLGKTQWAWLSEGLENSTATWKIITTGMIFNSAVRPFKTDYWMHYPHELNGLFELLGELKVSGAVLMGGDIHRQRVVRHASKEIRLATTSSNSSPRPRTRASSRAPMPPTQDCSLMADERTSSSIYGASLARLGDRSFEAESCEQMARFLTNGG